MRNPLDGAFENLAEGHMRGELCCVRTRTETDARSQSYLLHETQKITRDNYDERLTFVTTVNFGLVR